MGELRLIWAGLRRWIPQLIDALYTNRRLVGFWVVGGLLCLIAWLVIFVQIPGCVYAEKMAQSKANLHSVQLGLERFSVDVPGSYYPLDPGVLINEGYLDQMPTNPFTGQPMRYIILSQPGHEAGIPAGLSHGDFGYYPGASYRKETAPLDLNSLKPGDIHAYELVLY